MRTKKVFPNDEVAHIWALQTQPTGRNSQGFDLDGYTVIGLNGVLTIGCHKIERKEINRFAKLMGWGQIAAH